MSEQEFNVLQMELQGVLNLAKENSKDLKEIREELLPRISNTLERLDEWKKRIEERLDAHKEEFAIIRNENKTRDKVIYSVMAIGGIVAMVMPFILGKIIK